MFAGGGGLVSLVRSLANALVEEHHIGLLNTLIGFVEYAGLMVAGPVLSKALSVGFELGEPWIGLPYLCAAALFIISCIILWAIQPPRTHRHHRHQHHHAEADAEETPEP
jgi:hypothetical protein